jgi:uncharacterized lipoprotein YehR (DUF1307 family)
VSIFILGNFTLLLILVWVGIKIYRFVVMKVTTKEFAKKLYASNYVNEAFGNMTDEEKERLKKDGKAETKVTLNFSDMSVKKETK